jgi:hypothetical protein
LSHQGRHEEYPIIEVNLLLAFHKQAVFQKKIAQNYQISLASKKFTLYYCYIFIIPLTFSLSIIRINPP